MSQPSSLSASDTVRSLMAQARRRGIAVDDETPVLSFLEALSDTPLVPHRTAIVAGAVVAEVFRHEREAEAIEADRPPTDFSF